MNRTLARMTPGEVRAAVDGFSFRYAQDWELWTAAPDPSRPALFGQILRRWQATRPLAMRRIKAEAQHDGPYLEDLLVEATGHVEVLGDLTVVTISRRAPEQTIALAGLWDVFSRLTTSGHASCVGISKAVLLVTDGRIGPALDSEVRSTLGIPRPTSYREWLHVVEGVGRDIVAFESLHGSLAKVVPSRFARLAYGRLYDMALGPR